ncbi:hypothetical protein ACTQ45_09560 [Fundicoccus sp. Sow4_D5]|uniref:hypothetical protein n=1 Tax=unclassified Fundicoccus TaxID=2761543 RepID=UPI003F8E4E27
MSQKINPLQPFLVKHQYSLAPLQMQSLMQLYQPIVGSSAISLYLTLMNQPLETANQSQRILHAQLIQIMNVGIKACDEGRQRLEAAGLLRTYRDRTSHTDWRYQTLLYELQQPLDVKQFLRNPLLSTTLYKQIGDQNYYQLLRMWQVEPIDEDQYTEITANFEDVFYYINRDADEEIQESVQGRQFKQQSAETEVSATQEHFEYAKFLRYIMAEGVEHTQLTQALKEQVLSTSQVYELNEVQMTQIVLLAINDVTDQIQLDKLKDIADKKTFFAQKRQETAFAPTTNAQKTVSSNDEQVRTNQTFPYEYTQSELKVRHANLKETFKQFSDQDIHMIVLCEQMPNDTFLERTKQAKNGFATDSEQFYVRDLATKTTLAPEIINFLVYYLLVIERKDSVYKGDLQRTASEWQQHNIQSTGHALEFIRNKAQIQETRQAKNAKTQPSGGYNRKYRRQEVIPDWMKQQDQQVAQQAQTSTTPATSQPQAAATTENEQAIRARLNKLFGEDVKGNAIDASHDGKVP